MNKCKWWTKTQQLNYQQHTLVKKHEKKPTQTRKKQHEKNKQKREKTGN